MKIYGIYDNDMDGYGNNVITQLITNDYKINNVYHPEKVCDVLMDIKDELLKYKREDNAHLFINDLALGSNTKVFDILDELNDIKIVINDHHEPNDNLIDYYKKKFPNKAIDILNPNIKSRLVSITDKIE